MANFSTVSFYDGCLIDTDTVWFCAKPDKLPHDNYSHSVIYGFGNDTWGHYTLPFMTISVCVYRPVTPIPAHRAMCALADVHGKVDFYWAKGVVKEIEKLPGLKEDGRWLHLTQIAQIGDDLYVSGNADVVYRRSAKDGWTSFSDGLEPPPLENFKVPGGSLSQAIDLRLQQSATLESIDGTTFDNLYAASRSGAIYYKDDGPWRRLEQVTNAVLHRIKVVDENTVYAVGNNGILLKGNAKGFQVIQTGIGDNLWSLEWYKGKLYIGAEEKGLFVYDGKNISHVATPKQSFDCHTLNAYAGQLLALGSKDVFLTSDGAHWHELPTCPDNQ